MTLDLAAIARQIAGMAEEAPWRVEGPGLDLAVRELTGADPAEVAARVATARTSWLVAQLHHGLAERHACPALPAAWSVLATDGSSMLPERHSPVHFFVFNIGHARLTYGPAPAAELGHRAHFYFRPEETHVPAGGVRRVPIEGARLAARRSVLELRALGELPVPAGLPCVALQDGSLILWSIESEEELVRDWLLGDYLAALDDIRRARLPLAAYISAPASTDVVNLLRVASCPHVPGELRRVDCDRCPSRGRAEGPRCFAIPPRLTDRRLFERLLAPGERSSLFVSASKVLERYRRHARAHEILFFYLNTGREVARVEVPRWVAEDAALLDLVHAAVYDQAVRGQGYPTALQEAHEAAVIHADERRLVERLVEEAMARAGATMQRSGKDTSKRVRAV